MTTRYCSIITLNSSQSQSFFPVMSTSHICARVVLVSHDSGAVLLRGTSSLGRCHARAREHACATHHINDLLFGEGLAEVVHHFLQVRHRHPELLDRELFLILPLAARLLAGLRRSEKPEGLL